MGELLPKGQQALEPAADQRLVALVHSAQSDQPSDRTNEASAENSPKNPIGDPAEACQGWLLADIYLLNQYSSHLGKYEVITSLPFSFFCFKVNWAQFFFFLGSFQANYALCHRLSLKSLIFLSNFNLYIIWLLLNSDTNTFTALRHMLAHLFVSLYSFIPFEGMKDQPLK